VARIFFFSIWLMDFFLLVRVFLGSIKRGGNYGRRRVNWRVVVVVVVRVVNSGLATAERNFARSLLAAGCGLLAASSCCCCCSAPNGVLDAEQRQSAERELLLPITSMQLIEYPQCLEGQHVMYHVI